MAGIRFGVSPWAYAAGGLAQGVGQGFQVGADLAMQKQALQQRKQHDAMNLLMQGIKNIPDDPQQGEQYMKFFGQIFEQTTGQKMPDVPWAQAKPLSERMKTAVEEMKKANPNLTDEQAFPYAYQIITRRNAPKAGKEPTQDWYQNPQTGAWEAAPPGVKKHYLPGQQLPGWTYGPNMEKIPLEPGYKNPPPALKPEKPEKETFAPEARSKRLTELELIIRNPQSKPFEVQAATEEYKGLGGDVTTTPEKPAPWYKPWGGEAAQQKTKRPDLKLKGQGASGTPPGMKKVGVTPDGKPVYQDANGNNFVGK